MKKNKILLTILLLSLIIPYIQIDAATNSVPSATPSADPAATPVPNDSTPKNGRKAVWFSYDNLDYKKKDEKSFTASLVSDFKKSKSLGFNTVVCHVRPNSDAMYPSKYFPWSKIASRKQGKNPGYDPLKIMIREAHNLGLKFEAWINPYRVSNASSSTGTLSKKNPARKWYSKKSTRRNVLKYDHKLYYNPSKPAVRTLIVNGINEIVSKYDVDGIHFDDYFYPSFNKKNYKKAFDAKEYKTYAKYQKKKGIKPLSIEKYRRTQVNLLVKQVYAAIKATKSYVTFGISPAGNITNLTSKYMYYVDIKTWLKNPGYVDYVCPQIYWGFDYGKYSYDKVLNRWLGLERLSSVKMYIGLPLYKCVYCPTTEFKKKKNIIARMVKYGRKTSKVDGYYIFDYHSLEVKVAKKEVNNLKKVFL